MKKKLLSLVLACCMLALFVAGCTTKDNGPGTPDDTAADPSASEPAAKPKDSVTLVISGDPQSFDPTKTAMGGNLAVTYQIYDALFQLKNDHSLENRLAQNYTVAEDGMTYSFELVQGVKFHNGEELKAGDVVFTIHHYKDSAFSQRYVSAIESVTATGDYTFEIKTIAPTATFLTDLANVGIMNQKAVTEGGEAYSDNPVGTGPYQFVKYQPGVQIELTRFDDYYRGPASIKDVIYRVITDDNTATVSLRTGEVDAGSFALTSYDEVVSDPNLVAHEWLSTGIVYFTMNHEVAPFDNKLVRQALNYAVDRDFILQTDAEGFGLATGEMLPESAFGYSDKIDRTYTYDPEKAKELLQEAGITTPMDIGTIKIPDGWGKTAAEVFMECLADVGLNVTIESLEMNKFFDDVDFGDYQIAITNWGASDADGNSPLYTSDQIDGLNSARYNNPRVDELFAQGKATLDSDARLDIYAELYNIINEDAVYIPLYVQSEQYAHNKDLKVDVCQVTFQSVYDMSWE